MKANPTHLATMAKSACSVLLLLLSGCATDTQQNQSAIKGTVPFQVSVESSEPGSKIELNGEYLGESPLTITVLGNMDGTFYGDGFTEIRANPVRAGQYVQTKQFANARKHKITFADRLAGFSAGFEDPTYAARQRDAEKRHPTPLGDRIPSRIYFDLDLVPVIPQRTAINPTAAGTYLGVGLEHWIKTILDQGGMIRLEDNSLWEIAPQDRINTRLWLPTERVLVTESSNSTFPYRVVGERDAAEAKRLSQ